MAEVLNQVAVSEHTRDGDNVAIPNLRVFGDSGRNYPGGISRGAAAFGTGVPRGDINPEEILKFRITDGVEFTEFEAQVSDYVISMLGFPTVKVELMPVQLKYCVQESYSHMAQHLPLYTMQMAAFDCSAGMSLYKIPLSVAYGLEYVAYRKTLLSIQSQAGTLEFDFFIKYFQDNFLFQNFGVGDFFLLQQHLEQLRKILGQEGTANLINGRYINLTPTPVSSDQIVIIVYRSLDTNTIQPAERRWIYNYALALAKGVLGEVRSKHKNLAGPSGGIQLNGEELKLESKEERRILEEKLLSEHEEMPAFTLF